MTPQLLKSALTTSLNELLAPIQAEFQASKEWQEVTELAYPVEKKPEKIKKVKAKIDPEKRAAAMAAKAAQAAKDAVEQAKEGVEKLEV